MKRHAAHVRRHLSRRDPKLGRVIAALDHPRSQRDTDIYYDLLASICAQQLSAKAAETIFQRFLELFPKKYPDAKRLVRMTDAQLRTAGVSRQKAGYMREIASFALREGMDYRALSTWADEAIIAHLTRIKGVGRWTVEMLLMFPLARPDVFPVDDLGVQNAMIKLYGLRNGGSKRARQERLKKIAEAWRPHRTAACRYLWAWKHAGYEPSNAGPQRLSAE